MERRLVPEHNLIPTMPTFPLETTSELVRTTIEPFETTTELLDDTDDDSTTFEPTTLHSTKIVQRRPKFIAETMMIYPNEMSGIEKTTPENMSDKNEFVMFDNDTDADLHLIFPKRDNETLVVGSNAEMSERTTAEYGDKNGNGFTTELTKDYDRTTVNTARHDLEGQMSVRFEAIQRKLNRSEEMDILADSTTELVDEKIATTIATDQLTTLVTTPKPLKIRRKRRKRVKIARRLSDNATTVNPIVDNCLTKSQLGNDTLSVEENVGRTTEQDPNSLPQHETAGYNTIESVTEMSTRQKKDVSKLTEDPSSRKRFFLSNYHSNRYPEWRESAVHSDNYNTDALTTTTELYAADVPIVETLLEPKANSSPTIDADSQPGMIIELGSLVSDVKPLTGDMLRTFVSESMNELAMETVTVDNLRSVYSDLKKIKDDTHDDETTAISKQVSTPKPLRGRIRFGTKIVTESPIRSTTVTITTTTLKPEPLIVKLRKTPTNLFVRKRKIRKPTTTTEQPLTTVLPPTIRPTEFDALPKSNSKLRNPNPLQFRKIHRFATVEARTRSQKNALKSALLAEIGETASSSPPATFQRFPENLLRTPLVGEPSTMVVEFRPSLQKWSIYSVGYVPPDTLPIPPAPPVYYPGSSPAVYPLSAPNNGIQDITYPTSNFQEYDSVSSSGTTGFGTYEQHEPLIVGPIPFSLKGKFRDGANLNYELPYEF